MVVFTTADVAYRAFIDVLRIPEWLAVVRQVKVVSRDEQELAERVSFRSWVGDRDVRFDLIYRYDVARRHVDWRSPDESERRFAGSAGFEPLAGRRCLLHYEILEEASEAVPNPAALPVWTDSAWVAMKSFRDWVGR
jgi:hypothetical protein